MGLFLQGVALFLGGIWIRLCAVPKVHPSLARPVRSCTENKVIGMERPLFPLHLPFLSCCDPKPHILHGYAEWE